MRATLRRYSRNWLVHAIIVAIAILIGVIVAFNARPTRGEFDAPPAVCPPVSAETGR